MSAKPKKDAGEKNFAMSMDDLEESLRASESKDDSLTIRVPKSFKDRVDRYLKENNFSVGKRSQFIIKAVELALSQKGY